jgi:hypothetical protein
MANEDVQHHIFRGGRWLQVEPLPFYDPILTPADHQFAAAVAGTCLARGCSRQQAEQVAEKKLYARIYAARSLPPSAKVSFIPRRG